MSVVLLPAYTADLHRRNSASFQFHIKTCAAVVVEGATGTSMQKEPPPRSPLDYSLTPLASVYSAGWSSRWRYSLCRFLSRSVLA